MTRISIPASLAVLIGVSLCSGFVPTTRQGAVPLSLQLDRHYRLFHPATTLRDGSSSSRYHSSCSKEPSGSLWSRRESQDAGRPSVLQRFLSRFDTIQSAGLTDVQTQGITWQGFLKVFFKVWNPKTYLALVLFGGYKWPACFNNAVYWCFIAYGIKWYRARYVFKIPVMDRQPNWNNIITSKEQEKDLKALTCKKCGSTLFVAKSREFFFEGNTGIGGLGCFTCGAKGAENFVNDRERIVEDVGDLDTYFDYERPLDFVTAQERRMLLKKAGGDVEKANQQLLEKNKMESTNASTSTQEEGLEEKKTAKKESKAAPESKPSSPPAPKPSKGGDDEDDVLDLLDMD